jgi:hypothetical protein
LAEIDFTKQLRLVKSQINRQPDVAFNQYYFAKEFGVSELTIRIFETCCHMLSSILSWRGLSSLSPHFPWASGKIIVGLDVFGPSRAPRSLAV